MINRSTCDPKVIEGYNSGSGYAITGGAILPGLFGLWQCHLCKGYGDMPGYIAQAGNGHRLHFFGLHDQCARAYFARRKDNDLAKTFDDMDLITVSVFPQRHAVFEP